MRLSEQAARRFRRETALLMAKMLAIAIPIALAGIALIVYLALSMENGFLMAVFALGVPVIPTAVFFCVLFAAKTYIKRIDESLILCSRLRAGDFSRIEDVEGAGVMREVASTLNEMSDALAAFIEQASESAVKLAEASESLLKITDNSNANLQDISNSVVDLSREAEEQHQEVSRLESSTDELLRDIVGVEEAAKGARGFSDEVESTVNQSAEAVREAAGKMGGIRETTANLERLIGELDEHSGEIGLIIEVISSIADKTKLLALNAAIEAARAGTGPRILRGGLRGAKTGRGFLRSRGTCRETGERDQEHGGKSCAAMQETSVRGWRGCRQATGYKISYPKSIPPRGR